MKLSETLVMNVPSHLIPSQGQSGISMSSQNLGRDMEDWKSLDMVDDIRS